MIQLECFVDKEVCNESTRLLLFFLVLCAVYTPVLLCAQYLAERYVERERAKYFDLC